MNLTFATPQEVALELGKRLKKHRVSQALTQRELAQRVGVSTPTISNLEAGGNASIVTIVAVAQVLGLHEQLNELFEFTHVSIKDLEKLQDMPKRVRSKNNGSKG